MASSAGGRIVDRITSSRSVAFWTVVGGIAGLVAVLLALAALVPNDDRESLVTPRSASASAPASPESMVPSPSASPTPPTIQSPTSPSSTSTSPTSPPPISEPPPGPVEIERVKIEMPRGGGSNNTYVDSVGRFDFRPAWTAYTASGELEGDNCTGIATVYNSRSGEFVDRGTVNACTLDGWVGFDLDVPGQYRLEVKVTGSGDLGSKSSEVPFSVIRGG